MAQAPLEGYRALDLTFDEVTLCGRMLADLGVDVIKVEPPGGDPTRDRGPFYGDDSDPEKSLLWFAYNRGKRSVTCNLETEDGRDVFRDLVPTADWVLESFPPGMMQEWGLGYDRLRELHPGLVMTSVTPFGSVGPHSEFRGPDLVLSNLGGMSYLAGDPEREPLRVSRPQYYLHAAGEACVGSMIAFHYRQRTGEGQHVDVAAQLAVIRVLMNAAAYPEMEGYNLEREGRWTGGEIKTPTSLACEDGYVMLLIGGGETVGPPTDRMMEWILEEEPQLMPDELRKTEWSDMDLNEVRRMGEEGQALINLTVETCESFFATRTKQSLYQGAVERGILLAPIYDTSDLPEDVQLEARDYWDEVEHPELDDTLHYPGPWTRNTESPLRRDHGRAPLIGEHNATVYGEELDMSNGELVRLARAGVI